MKHIECTYKVVSLLFMALVLGLIISCKKKGPTEDDYLKAIANMAAKSQSECPKVKSNGIRLESVIFTPKDTILTYRLSISDEAIITVNVNDSNTRKNIIDELSGQLKEYLVKGKCKLKYQYVSPHDSSYIEILPSELDNSRQ